MSKAEGETPTLRLGLHSYSLALLVLPSTAWQCREKDVENNKSTDLFRASPFLRISLLISCQGKKKNKDSYCSWHENCGKHKLSVTLLRTIKRPTNKLAILISSNQSQDGMLNITKNTCSCNCPQKLDLNSLKIHNATRFHLYSWLLISGELPYWFPDWFYWLAEQMT